MIPLVDTSCSRKETSPLFHNKMKRVTWPSRQHSYGHRYTVKLSCNAGRVLVPTNCAVDLSADVFLDEEETMEASLRPWILQEVPPDKVETLSGAEGGVSGQSQTYTLSSAA